MFLEVVVNNCFHWSAEKTKILKNDAALNSSILLCSLLKRKYLRVNFTKNCTAGCTFVKYLYYIIYPLSGVSYGALHHYLIIMGGLAVQHWSLSIYCRENILRIILMFTCWAHAPGFIVQHCQLMCMIQIAAILV